MDLGDLYKMLKPGTIFKYLKIIMATLSSYRDYKDDMYEAIKKIPMTEESRSRVYDLIDDYEHYVIELAKNIIGGTNDKK